MTTQELKQQIDKVLGNSIRCLLPSYWWKRLFNQVADRIDEVEQTTSQLIDSKVEEAKMPIVESVDELEKLNVEKGGLAAVEKVGEPVIVNYEDFYISLDYVNDWDKYTIIKGVGEIGEVPSDAAGGFIPLAADKYNFYADTLVVGIEDGKRVYGKYLRSGVSIFTLDEVNEYLASGRYRLVGGYLSDRIAQYFTFYSAIPQPSLYIKGETWERLAKESDLGGNVAIIYANEESTRNTNAYNTIIDCYENEKPYVAVVKIDDMLYSANINIQKVNDRYIIMAQCINTAYNKFYGVLLGLSVETGVGLANLLTESELITIDSEFSDTSENAVQNKVVTEALGILEENLAVHSEQISSLGLSMATKEELNAKQNTISDLETIRSGAALGATALQEHQDISHLATKEEVIANEEVTAAALNDLNSRLGELAENVKGETVTKETFEATIEGLHAVILENEEITAAAFVDMDRRIRNIITRLDALITN